MRIIWGKKVSDNDEKEMKKVLRGFIKDKLRQQNVIVVMKKIWRSDYFIHFTGIVYACECYVQIEGSYDVLFPSIIMDKWRVFALQERMIF